ncbi:hypothetical protein B0O99DRAFT_637380 [Bisporella sp. PMI_857]|nr:hypothetical protein B0O99DRAFT_637380 [Bisporella sp. PMI_857]
MIHGTSLIYSLAIAILAQLSPVSSFSTSKPKFSGNYSLTVIEDIPALSNLENVAVRHTGELLVTSTSSSSIFQVSPDESKDHILIAEIPASTALTGIVELEQDIFYVVSLNLTGVIAVPGSNAVWKVDMRRFHTTKNGTVSRAAQVSLITKLSDARLLNGLCRLSPNDNSNLLISDSVSGSITKLNVNTGEFETVIEDDTMKILQTGLPIGINGIHIHERDLFFVNLNQGLFAKIPISLSTGTRTGSVEVIVNNTAGDDFAMSRNGKKAWIAMNGQFTLVEVDIPGKRASIVANSTLLMSDSAVAFGRTYLDWNSLYVTAAATVDEGNSTTEGRVVRVDLPYTFEDLCR